MSIPGPSRLLFIQMTLRMEHNSSTRGDLEASPQIYLRFAVAYAEMLARTWVVASAQKL
jgi:hypothetical protein